VVKQSTRSCVSAVVAGVAVWYALALPAPRAQTASAVRTLRATEAASRQLRTVSDEVRRLNLVPASGRFGLALFGGPTFFRMTQDIAGDITVTETYPYDTVVIAAGTRSELSESAVGFRAGADLT